MPSKRKRIILGIGYLMSCEAEDILVSGFKEATDLIVRFRVSEIRKRKSKKQRLILEEI